MPSETPLIGITTLAEPSSLSSTCQPRAVLIYKVVLAIHSNVISCHINTYISGRYYKACNGRASELQWEFFGDIWQDVIGSVERQAYISINPFRYVMKGCQWYSIIIRHFGVCAVSSTTLKTNLCSWNILSFLRATFLHPLTLDWFVLKKKSVNGILMESRCQQSGFFVVFLLALLLFDLSCHKQTPHRNIYVKDNSCHLLMLSIWQN